jgi:tRNA modification GTPase
VFSTSDTIVAIATPPGRGGIGIVRVSGADACAIAARLIASDRPLEPRRATFAEIKRIDQAVVTYFQAPASYTGEDVVEISAHGSPVVLSSIVTAALGCGARLAEPGEFTLRAYLNGRIDLMQAEAVADLIDSVTPLQARAAFDQLHGTLTGMIAEIDGSLFDLIARLEASVDFPEEGYHFADPSVLAEEVERLVGRTNVLLAGGRRGRLVREGLHIAIVGPPNVGKSSLFNALAGAARAIVADMPGTTRDLVTETVDLEGFRVTLVDTAGMRHASSSVESEGVARAKQAADVADLILVVADRSVPLSAEAQDALGRAVGRTAIVVANKSDLPAAWSMREAVDVSAVTGQGLDELRQRIVERLGIETFADRPEITNVRHIALVERARDALVRAKSALEDGPALPEEFVLADLQDARSAFEEVTGRRTPDDVLAHIFERFCIGK